jgi:hypothetical protein
MTIVQAARWSLTCADATNKNSPEWRLFLIVNLVGDRYGQRIK